MLYTLFNHLDPSFETSDSKFGFTIPLGFFDDGSGERLFHYISFPVDGSEEPKEFSTTYPYYQSMAIKKAVAAGDPSGSLR